jgi:DNA-binding GntR family transcriptional regulator
MPSLLELSSAANIERSLLKDQVTHLLRQMIVSGQIPAGTKITERQVAHLLNISRMPARDALMALEGQGLVVNKPDGRYVIELNESEIRQLFQVRLVLEKLAVELAMQNINEPNSLALQARLEDMAQAIEINDSSAYIASDLAIHELIWQQAGNPYLLDMLHSISGLIFMVISTQTNLEKDWHTTFELHEMLVEGLRTANLPSALQSLNRHMTHSLQLALQVFTYRRLEGQDKKTLKPISQEIPR